MRSCLRKLNGRPRSQLIDQQLKRRTFKGCGWSWFSGGMANSLLVDVDGSSIGLVLLADTELSDESRGST